LNWVGLGAAMDVWRPYAVEMGVTVILPQME